MHRRNFIRTLTLAGGLLTVRRTSWAVPGENLPNLRIGFFTDVHARPESQVVEALRRAAHAMRNESVDLWISGGDVIHNGHRMAAEDCADSYGVYRGFLDELGQPVEHVIGNHDLAGAFPGNGRPSADDPRALWKSFTGETRTFRSREIGGYRILFLDSIELTAPPGLYRGRISEEQLNWIRTQLASTPSDQPILLATHIPFRTTFKQESEAPTAGLPENLVVVNANDVLDLFRNHNLSLILQGHLHSNEVIDWAGRKFLMGGAISGSWWRGPHRGTTFGYGIVDCTRKQISWTYKDYGWEG